MLEKGIVYLAPLLEHLDLRPSLSGAANPKSSTGRLDIFSRLIVDGSEAFDEVPLNYRGRLWLEISPRSFSVRVREGSRLCQIRFRSRNAKQNSLFDFALPDKDIRKRHEAAPLVDGDLKLREGLIVHIGLSGERVTTSSAIARSRTATSSTSTSPRATPPRNSGSRSARAATGA